MQFFRSDLSSDPSFQRALLCERELADRHGTLFTLVAFTTDNLSTQEQHELASYLKARMRISDELGRFEGGIGLLLRRTEVSGALSVLQEIEEWQREVGLDAPGRVLGYGEGLSDYQANSSVHAGRFGDAIPEAEDDCNGEPDRAVGYPISSLSGHLQEPVGSQRRALDIVVSGTALVILSPLLALIALAIRLNSRGPVVFTQGRVGQAGVAFDFYKFRSMRVGAESERHGLLSANEKDGPIFKLKKDPRVTTVGAFLRRYSLDELPQLWNVLRGDMTLVGPRPQLATEVREYEPWQRRRLDLCGGLTCIWQVSGRSDVAFDDWMRMDHRYANQHGFWSDLSLLFRTLPALVMARGAY